MKLDIDNLVTVGEGAYQIIKDGLTGLESPPIRSSADDFAGRDGGYVGDQFYSVRPITVAGVIVSTSCEQHAVDRRALSTALALRKDITVTIYDYIGGVYQVTGRVSAFEMPVGTPMGCTFRFEILCADPLIYDYTNGYINSVTLSKPMPGGYTTPYSHPVQWTAGSSGVNVHNAGNTTIYPIIEITDSANTPIITNATTGEVFKLNITISNGDVLRIDMRRHEITLNGGNVFGVKDSTSPWWGLLVGDNNIQFDTANISDTATAKVKWLNGFTTI